MLIMDKPQTTSPRPAAILFRLTMAIGFVGVFFGIYFAFIDPALGVQVAALLLVGITGIISFLRHSVFWRSDQARMGWRPGSPQFQMEVGFANLAVGVVSIAAVVLAWGTAAVGTALLIYGIYIAGAAVVHVRDALGEPERRPAILKKTLYTGFFAVALLAFGVFAILNVAS